MMNLNELKPWYALRAGELYEILYRMHDQYDEGSAALHDAIKSTGANIAALSKAAKRHLVISYLYGAKQSGLDITPTVANASAERVMNRGIDKYYLNQYFGTMGRTAAEKSAVTAEDLAQTEAFLKRDLDILEQHMASTRRALRSRFSRN